MTRRLSRCPGRLPAAQLDPARRTVVFGKPGMRIDLGYRKGYVDGIGLLKARGSIAPWSIPAVTRACWVIAGASPG
jgi:hypothetical protein